MKEHTRVPVLVITQNEIEHGFDNGWTEPHFEKCYNCGGNLFYIGHVYGLMYDRYSRSAMANVVNETDESKYYRKFDIQEVLENKYCAVCGLSNGMTATIGSQDVIKEFSDDWDKEHYEKVLDVLKYPPETERKVLIYDDDIKKVKKWVSDWEEKKKKWKEMEEENNKKRKSKTKNK